MGNVPSKQANTDNPKKTLEYLNDIASDLILKTKNKDLAKLLEYQFCNILVDITKDSLKNLTQIQVELINQIITQPYDQIKNTIKQNANVIVQQLRMIETQHQTKEASCKNIAVFYIKIAHLYAAIYKVIGENAFCLIRKTSHKIKTLNVEGAKDRMIASSNYCNDNKIYSKKTLSDEYGIPELESLYFDTYDKTKKKYVMSEKSKNKYLKDLKTFYEAFTGLELTDDKNINSFSDIPLIDYKKEVFCQETDYSKSETSQQRTANSSYVSDSEEIEMAQYAKHLANIMLVSENIEKNLLDKLSEIFVKKQNPNDENTKNKYTINSNLTMEKLDQIIEETRELIVEVYIKCEKDYQKGVKLFKNIIMNNNINISRQIIDAYQVVNINEFEQEELKEYLAEELKKENTENKQSNSETTVTKFEAPQIPTNIIQKNIPEKKEISSTNDNGDNSQEISIKNLDNLNKPNQLNNLLESELKNVISSVNTNQSSVNSDLSHGSDIYKNE